MKHLNKFIITMGIILLSACSYNKENSNSNARQALMLIVQNSTLGATTSNPVQQACIQAVLTLNLCIGTGYGFNPSIMCSANGRTYTTTDSSGNTTTSSFAVSDYNTLTTCAQGVITTTACNMNAFKAPEAYVAETGIFAACQKNGIMLANPLF